MLRRAQSRYVADMSTVHVVRAPHAAACTVAVPVYANKFRKSPPAAISPTMWRVSRWSRKMPVSTYPARSTSNSEPSSSTVATNERSPASRYLASPAIATARLGEHALGRHAEHNRGNRQDIAHAMAGLELVDRRRGCVLGSMNGGFSLVLARACVQVDRGRVAG